MQGSGTWLCAAVRPLSTCVTSIIVPDADSLSLPLLCCPLMDWRCKAKTQEVSKWDSFSPDPECQD